MLRRWIIRAVFMLPILLCVGGWAVSTKYSAQINYSYGGYRTGCGMLGGVVNLDRGVWPNSEVGWSYDGFPVKFRLIEPSHLKAPAFLGFKYDHIDGPFIGEPFELKIVFVPFWFLIVVFSAALLVVWRKTRPKINPKMAFPVEVTKGLPMRLDR
jgi:hypothetical protein